MTDPVATHVGQILGLAADKHAAAIEAVEKRPVDLDQVRSARTELADVELLAEDAYELSGESGLIEALEQLKHQRILLDVGIDQLERVPPIPAPSPKRWPLVAFTILVVLFVLSLA